MISTACECKAAGNRLMWCKTVAAILLIPVAAHASEVWNLRMILNVPRIANNSTSLGFRRYQTQRLVGSFTVQESESDEPQISMPCLCNLTHKVDGESVVYDVSVDDVLWHGIGSNLLDTFPTRSVVLTFVAEPSYVQGEPDEDNSLILTLSGRGDSRHLTGYAAGQIGCGCASYGHVSPTRIWNTDKVVDTAAVYGRWQAVRKDQK